jgi:hypothetical protein
MGTDSKAATFADKTPVLREKGEICSLVNDSIMLFMDVCSNSKTGKAVVMGPLKINAPQIIILRHRHHAMLNCVFIRMR